MSDRPFTAPGSMVLTFAPLIPIFGPVLALSGLIEHLQDKFLMNVGRENYPNLVPCPWDSWECPGSTLVHEATHVWQGVFWPGAWEYIFNSVYNQACCGNRAYDIPGISPDHADISQLKQWNTYQAEQQARMVEYWFSRSKGGAMNDVAFCYIRDNVRTGKQNARTELDSHIQLQSALVPTSVVQHSSVTKYALVRKPTRPR